MKTLIMSSSFTFYRKDEMGNKIPQIIDNNNGFLDTLQKLLTKRDCCVIISGNPKRQNRQNPEDIMRRGFALSGLQFKEYIYVDDNNKHKIKEYIEKADLIDLCGGHLPTCNAFIQELDLKELLKEFNGVIIGTSGGAMNMAETVYCIPEIEGEHTDKNFNRYLKGLGLTNINIIPHFQYFVTMQFSDGIKIVEDVILPDSANTPMIALPDGSYVVQQGEKIKIYGESYYLDGAINKICSNDCVETIKQD